jgi:hypothetical protein
MPMPLRSGLPPPRASRSRWSLPHLQRGAHRHLGVVAGCDRRAEHRLDLVADELQHEPAVHADGLVHLGEIFVQILHDLVRLGGLHPRGEVAQVCEEDGGLLQLALAADAPREDLVADLWRDVLAEGLLHHLALAQAVQHAVEALGHRPDLVGAHHRGAAVEPAPLDLAMASSTSRSGAATLFAAKTERPTAATTPTASRKRMVTCRPSTISAAVTGSAPIRATARV